MLAHAMAAMRNARLASTWRAWQATAAEQTADRQRLQRAVSLFRNRSLALAFRSWQVLLRSPPGMHSVVTPCLVQCPLLPLCLHAHFFMDFFDLLHAPDDGRFR